METKPKTREDCLECLVKMAAEKGRLPVRSDFDEYTVVKIKGFFGPWPRALEAAGLKEKPLRDRAEKNRERRRRAKSKINLEKKLKKRTEKSKDGENAE